MDTFSGTGGAGGFSSGSGYEAPGGGPPGARQPRQQQPMQKPAPPPSGQLSDQDFEGRMRARAMDMVSGKGLPTGDQLYGGMAPGIQEGVSRDQGQAARDMASRGLSNSGYQAGSIASGARDESRQLANARLHANTEAQGLSDQAFSQGSQILQQMDDREQQRKLLEYQKEMRDAAMQADVPWYERIAKQYTPLGKDASMGQRIGRGIENGTGIGILASLLGANPDRKTWF